MREHIAEVERSAIPPFGWTIRIREKRGIFDERRGWALTLWGANRKVHRWLQRADAVPNKVTISLRDYSDTQEDK